MREIKQNLGLGTNYWIIQTYSTTLRLLYYPNINITYYTDYKRLQSLCKKVEPCFWSKMQVTPFSVKSVYTQARRRPSKIEKDLLCYSLQLKT